MKKPKKGKKPPKKSKAKPLNPETDPIMKAGPVALWRKDPSKRLVDFWGVISPGPEDMLIAIAKGAQTAFSTRAVDDRATIRGGVAALYAVGLTKVDPTKLKSETVQTSKWDQALIRAAGGGKNLKDAANRMRTRITKAGPGLEKAAWGSRALYILENLKGFQVGRGVAAAAASVFGPVGTIVGALMAGHGAISNEVAKSAAKTFGGYVKDGLAEHKAKARRRSGSRGSLAPRGAGAPAKPFPWGWVAGGTVALVAVLMLRRSE